MPKLTYSCTKCGTGHSKWSGQCDSCGSWNTLTDEGPLASGPSKTLGGKRGNLITLTDLATKETPPARTKSGVAELDRVLGGGLVDASAVLVNQHYFYKLPLGLPEMV
jgi:DNA repair protein RadA/Sms